MNYIAHKRFRDQAFCGSVNIPATAELESADGVIFYRGEPVCLETSENAHRFFARNDDERGMERGRLTRAILKKLEKRDSRYQERWDRVWKDPVCRTYKRTDHDDYWLWNHAFFNAELDTLRHIAELVGAKED